MGENWPVMSTLDLLVIKQLGQLTGGALRLMDSVVGFLASPSCPSFARDATFFFPELTGSTEFGKSFGKWNG